MISLIGQLINLKNLQKLIKKIQLALISQKLPTIIELFCKLTGQEEDVRSLFFFYYFVSTSNNESVTRNFSADISLSLLGMRLI